MFSWTDYLILQKAISRIPTSPSCTYKTSPISKNYLEATCHGGFKTNYDGDSFRRIQQNKYWWCDLRFSRRSFTSFVLKKLPLSTSVVTLEVLAARRAVLLVQEICINHSIFEGDSKLAVNSLHCGNMQSSSFGHFNQ